MSKANDKALALMEKNKQSSENFKDAFEGAEEKAAVTFRAIFESTPPLRE